MKKLIFIFLILISNIVLAVPQEIVPGVTLERFSSYDGTKQIINVARIDLTREDIHIGVAIGDSEKSNGKQAVSTIVEENKALLGVNADFFIMEAFRDNLNFSMVKGEIISEPQLNRSVMFINRDNHIFFSVPKMNITATLSNGQSFNITGINRNRNSGDTIIYTDKFASTTLNKYKAFDVILKPVFGEKITPNSSVTYQVEKLLPNSFNNKIETGKVVLSSSLKACPVFSDLQIGDVITINYSLTASEDVSNVLYATGGGPMLVQNGVVNLTSKAENFKSDITGGAAPRTAVGVNRDNTELILVTVDGRSENSKGMTLQTLAQYMENLGAFNAMNLDGGGSTTMSILGLVMNSPSGVVERNVANALLVFSDYKGNKFSSFKDLSGSIFRGNAPYLLTNNSGVWGTKGGIGYVSDLNVLHTSKDDRKGILGFVYEGVRYDYPIEISNASIGDVQILSVESEESEKGVIYHCKAQLIDKNNNIMSISPIFIYAENGALRNIRYISDPQGIVDFDVLFYKNSEEISDEPVKKSLRFVFAGFTKTFEF